MSTPPPTTVPLRRRARAPWRPALLLGALVALSAGAYVLPGGSIMRRMVAAREAQTFASLKADGSLRFYGPGVREAGAALGLPTDKPDLEVDGTVYIRPPGRCRFEAKTRAGGAVASVFSAGRKRVEGPDIPSLSEAVRELCALLTARSRDELEAHLTSLGIEPRTTSLARFGGEVVYVLGAPAEGQPQFWIYKDTFRPARLKHKEGKGEGKGPEWDVRLQDYTSSATGEMMPRTVEVWRGGERLLRFTALTGDTRTKPADSLF
ncbi:hypothetical protein [Melittangium boletus]|uniref:hypothetical protein n=1 Tax=Melittangium boletus TaxID=83453 RepID=UPI003DA2D1CC